MELPRISEALSERTFLVTGATGLVGKALVEKLLYSVPTVRKIFLIIRPLRGTTAKDRWLKITQSAIFDRIRNDNPEVLEKVVIVEGDLLHEGLGLSTTDVRQIINQVTVVFHCAATVRFNEKFRFAMDLNVLGTKRLASMCLDIKNFKCFVHCSTAYANCPQSTLPETTFNAPYDTQKMFEFMKKSDNATIERLTNSLLGNHPNTYTFSKAMAEAVLKDMSEKLPIVIVRPSIIIGMWRDNLPGWVDSFNGLTGLAAAVGKGVLSSLCGEYSYKADLIPVDVVANLMIAAAVHRMQQESNVLPVFNCVSGSINPITWRLALDIMNKFYKINPISKTFFKPRLLFHRRKRVSKMNHLLKHGWPAMLVDAGAVVVCKKTNLQRIDAKVCGAVKVLEYFTSHEWDFESSQSIALWESLNKEDKQEFFFDMREMEWVPYGFDFMLGLNKYLVSKNEGEKEVLYDKKKEQFMQIFEDKQY